MNTTFINQNNKGTIPEEGLRYLNSRKEDFEWYMNNGLCDEDSSESGFWEEHPPFFDYGISFDYVELGTFNDQQEDYFRYQLFWGGPSDEIRFYKDGTIVFVYLDWFCGVGFDISTEDWAVWLEQFFGEIGLMDFETNREKYDYYSLSCDVEHSDD